MTLSIVVPVFNEQKTIGKVIERVLNQEIGDWHKEIIVVDDGSTDLTQENLKPLSDKITVLQQEKNQGKGRALRIGIGAC